MAQTKELTLRLANTKTGYFGVHHQTGRPKPYQAQVKRDGKGVYLGNFATAEEAALCVARSPEGQALVAERAAVAPPLTSEEARQQAHVERLTLLVADNKAGYFGVHITRPSGDRATHSAASSAVAKLPRPTSLPPRLTRAW